MNKYKAAINLTLKTPGIDVQAGEVVELAPDYAEQVNKDLKMTFPDVPAVLVAVDADEAEKPKKPSTRKPKADVEPPKEDEVVPD